MKTHIGTILALTVVFASAMAPALAADEQRSKLQDRLPLIERAWAKRGDDGQSGVYSWVNFDHRKHPGEVLSIVEWTGVAPESIMGGPLNQASIETFLSNGSARYSTSERGKPIEDTVRHRVVSVSIGAKDFKQEVKAIEYTYIYGRPDEPNTTMAHGYAFVVDRTAISVQHTSQKPIASELAFEIAGNLLADHFKLSEKKHRVSKGKILKHNI